MFLTIFQFQFFGHKTIGTIKSYKIISLKTPLEVEGPNLSIGTNKIDISDHNTILC